MNLYIIIFIYDNFYDVSYLISFSFVHYTFSHFIIIDQEATLLAETEHLRAELNRTIQKEMATKQEMEQLNKSIIKYQELANELNQMKNVNQQLREQILRLETKG